MRGLILSLFSFCLIFGITFGHLTAQTDDQPSPLKEVVEEVYDTKAFDPGEKAIGHIVDANAFHLFADYYFHLPAFLFAPGYGWTILSSTRKFKPASKGNGTLAIDRYVLYYGAIYRVNDPSFPLETVEIDGFHYDYQKDDDGNEISVFQVVYRGNYYDLDSKSTIDGGFFGGKITSYYDFSITKNVFSMLLTFILLTWAFFSVAKAYRRRDGMAPKGFQSFIEPIIVFIQDDVAKPFLGNNYQRFMPLLLSLFFFILGLNLLGQIPFFPGSANVTGNLGVTLVLALFTFFAVNFSGNRHYWQHILWMPGIPVPVKFILTPVEVAGMFIKPFTLMLRLFASITAGHIVIVAFVSLIFIFGNAGESLSGSMLGLLVAFPLTLFMLAIELVIALVQAFVFTILTASYLAAATEEAHH
jgi:F-type H+-transporting ATPase subunit a